MTDTLTPERRSWNMSRIRGTDTQPELAVRRLLHRMGYRFRLHRGDLPGRPDIVLPRHSLVIFVHGCFWHRHKGCRDATTPKTRVDFWQNKFDENIGRDRRNRRALKKLDWQIGCIWECETKNGEILQRRLEMILKALLPPPAVPSR